MKSIDLSGVSDFEHRQARDAMISADHVRGADRGLGLGCEMRVFVGMETSGEFRRRLRALGHDAISCDLLPPEDGGDGHIVGDVFDTLEQLRRDGWWPKMAIFHPTCTYLTISAEWAYGDGPYHQKVEPGTLVGHDRRVARDRAVADVDRIFNLDIEFKVVENPKGVIGTRLMAPSQIVQPYEFGEDASKATCFWYLDKNGYEVRDMRIPIDPSARLKGRMVPRDAASGKSDEGSVGPAYLERWSNQTDTGQNRLTPGADRWKDRSRTYPKLADAAIPHWCSIAARERVKMPAYTFASLFD